MVHALKPIVYGLLLLGVSTTHGQSASYDQLVSQAQADLKAGNAAQALTESQKAIATAPSRWEAYVVAGGALQVEQQYDKAIDDFTQALKLAPQAKQAGVKNLLEKCAKAQIAGQSGPQPTPPEVTSPAPSQSSGPSLSETMQFIQETLSDYNVTSTIAQRDNGVGINESHTYTWTNSHFVADPNQCSLAWECDLAIDGQDADYGSCAIALRSVKQVAFEPYEQYVNRAPSTTVILSSSPPVIVLVVHLQPAGAVDGVFDQTINFTNATLAARVAKALTRAANLCGGAAKPAPF